MEEKKLNMEEKKLKKVKEEVMTDSGVAEIDLVEVFFALLEKWKLIVVVALIGALGMAVYSYNIATPIYQATSKIYVLNSSDSAINLSDLQIGSYLTNDYKNVFDTWEVHEMVMQNLGLDYTYGQMKAMLTIDNPANTRILHITVRNADAELAADLANEYAHVAKKYISQTMETDEPKILSEALTPKSPVSPHKMRNIAVGFIGGAFLVCAIIIVMRVFDDKIKTADDIGRSTGLPTLAVVPKNSAGKK